MAKVVVVGGGISGLSAAYYLTKLFAKRKQPLELTVVEASGRAGGVISSAREDQYAIEFGADSFITNKTEAKELCNEIGLASDLISTNESNRRSLIAFRSRLLPLPSGFVMIAPTNLTAFLLSPLFSPLGKLRTLFDLILPATKSSDDETVAAFVKRRFGKELLDRAAQPMVGGIYTGDVNKLSARATLPRFIGLEQKQGSIISALKKEESSNGKNDGTTSGARYAMFNSLASGMQTLIDRLIANLPEGTLQLNSPVTEIRRQEDKWLVFLKGDRIITADRVVLATSAKVAGRILKYADSELAHDLETIENSSSAVVNMLFRRSDIQSELDGFGFVVPKTESKRILACAYISVKFAGRCPEDCAMLRVFLAGDSASRETDCLAVALADLRTYLKINGDPIKSWVTRWPESMPQYTVGHKELVPRIQSRVDLLSGVALAGNSYDGVGIPDCIRSGKAAAQKVIDSVR